MCFYNERKSSGSNKIVFLTINWRNDRTFFAVDTVKPPICFPLEWGYLSNGNYLAYIIDDHYHNRDLEATLKLIWNIRPTVVVVSTSPSYLYWRCPPLNLRLVFDYINRIKKCIPSTTIITIGPHGTIDPDWVLSESASDFVFRGEPDGNLIEYLETSEFVKCDWLSYQNNIKEIAPQKDFETIGECDYSYLRSRRYQYHAWGVNSQRSIKNQIRGYSAMVELSRGCPFECQYCFRTGFREKFRKKSLDIFENELIQLSQMHVGYVFFIDETFGLDWRLCNEACKLLYQRGIKFGMQTRPDILDPKKLNELKKLGCIYIEFGLEANEKECNECLGKFSEFDTAKINVDIAKKLISTVNINIVDLMNPDYMDNIPKIIQIDNEGNTPPPLIPYPTTIFGEKVISKYENLFPDKSKWEVAELVYLYYSFKAGLLDEIDIFHIESFLDIIGEFLEFNETTKNPLIPQFNTRFQKLF